MFEKSIAPKFSLEVIDQLGVPQPPVDANLCDWFADLPDDVVPLNRKIKIRLMVPEISTSGHSGKVRYDVKATLCRSQILLLLGAYSKKPELALKIQKNLPAMNGLLSGLPDRNKRPEIQNDNFAIYRIVRSKENCHFILNECLFIGWDPAVHGKDLFMTTYDRLISTYMIKRGSYRIKLFENAEPLPYSKATYSKNIAQMTDFLNLDNSLKLIKQKFFTNQSTKDFIAYMGLLLVVCRSCKPKSVDDFLLTEFGSRVFDSEQAVIDLATVLRESHQQCYDSLAVKSLCQAQPIMMRHYLYPKIVQYLSGDHESDKFSIFSVIEARDYLSLFTDVDWVNTCDDRVIEFVTEHWVETIDARVIGFTSKHCLDNEAFLDATLQHSHYQDHSRLASLYTLAIQKGQALRFESVLLRHHPVFFANVLFAAIEHDIGEYQHRSQEDCLLQDLELRSLSYLEFKPEMLQHCLTVVEFDQKKLNNLILWVLKQDRLDKDIEVSITLPVSYMKNLQPKDRQNAYQASAKDVAGFILESRKDHAWALNFMGEYFRNAVWSYLFTCPRGLSPVQIKVFSDLARTLLPTEAHDKTQMYWPHINMSPLLRSIDQALMQLSSEQRLDGLMNLTHVFGLVFSKHMPLAALIRDHLAALSCHRQKIVQSIMQALMCESLKDHHVEFLSGLSVVAEDSTLMADVFIELLMQQHVEVICLFGDITLDFTKISMFEQVLLNRKITQDQRVAIVNTLNIALEKSGPLKAKFSDELYSEFVHMLGQKAICHVDMPVLAEPYDMIHAAQMFLVRLQDRTISDLLQKFNAGRLMETHLTVEANVKPLTILRQVLSPQHHCYAKAILALRKGDTAQFELLSVYQGCVAFDQGKGTITGVNDQLEQLVSLKQLCVDIFVVLKSLNDVTVGLYEQSVQQQQVIIQQGAQLAQQGQDIAALSNKLDKALAMIEQLTLGRQPKEPSIAPRF